MRTILVDKYKGFWQVRYKRHAEAWSLASLSMKTHGLVNFRDLVFFNPERAIDYATKIAEALNLVNGTDETAISVKGDGITKRIIIDTKTTVEELEYDEAPNSEPNSWVRLKREN